MSVMRFVTEQLIEWFESHGTFADGWFLTRRREDATKSVTMKVRPLIDAHRCSGYSCSDDRYRDYGLSIKHKQ